MGLFHGLPSSLDLTNNASLTCPVSWELVHMPSYRTKEHWDFFLFTDR
jgi:hypothetical protein